LPILAVVSASSWTSHASVTTTSLLSSTKYLPRAAASPWLIAAGNPQFSRLQITVAGTAAASWTPAR
jgi:hypothetical protein